MKLAFALMFVLTAVVVLSASACGGSGSKNASGSTNSGLASSSKMFDIQTVEGCFIGGGNIDEMPQQGWFDIVHLGKQASEHGQGAFSTFPGSAFDTAAYYFFSSHDEAERMVKQADKQAHDPAKVYVVGNVVAVDYENLDGQDQHLQQSCLS